MAKKILKWIDEKSVLKIGKDIYRAGDIVPAGSLSKKRADLFRELKMISVGILEVEEEKSDGKSAEE